MTFAGDRMSALGNGDTWKIGSYQILGRPKLWM